MSFPDYHKQSEFGPLAGQPTNLSGALGRMDYDARMRQKQQGSNSPAGTYVPHAQTEPPRWITHHAFKRGLAFFFGAALINMLANFFTPPAYSGIREIVGLICGVAQVAGIILMIFGVLNFFARKRRST